MKLGKPIIYTKPLLKAVGGAAEKTAEKAIHALNKERTIRLTKDLPPAANAVVKSKTADKISEGVRPTIELVDHSLEGADAAETAAEHAYVPRNLPDVGETHAAAYSPFESKVQTAEHIDSGVANAAVLTENLPKLASKIAQLGPAAATYFPRITAALEQVATNPKVATALARAAAVGRTAAMAGEVVTTVGNLARPVAPALWTLDGVRTIADPQYRAEAQKALESEMDDTAPNKKYSPSTFFSAISRPSSTARALMDTVSSTMTRDMNSELKAQQLDRRLQRLIDKNKAERATILGNRSYPQRKQDVPAVDVNQQRDQKAARKFFK